MREHTILQEKDGLALIRNNKSKKFTVIFIDRNMYAIVKAPSIQGGWKIAPITDAGVKSISKYMAKSTAQKYFNEGKAIPA